MTTLIRNRRTFLIAFGAFVLSLAFVRSIGVAAETASLPAGSLVIRGPKRSDGPNPSGPVLGTNSPEHLFGLQIEDAIRSNNLQFIWQSFDVDAFYRRCVESLPTSEEAKRKFYAAAHQNKETREFIASQLLRDVSGLSHTRFLGTRVLGDDCALLFRDADGTGAACERVTPMYIAYIAGRQADGTVRIVDAHRFRAGQLMSGAMREMMLMELIRRKLIVGERMNVADQQWAASIDKLELFDSRCNYGKFSLVRDAYDRLPPEAQNQRSILFNYAIIGDRTIKDMMVPVEKWRRLYPSDPTPNLLVVDYYWLLYYGPRWVKEGPGRGTHFGESWEPEEEREVEAAIERANAWFADPRMEVRMAIYYGAKRAEKARPLFQKALKRFPAETITFEESLKVELAAGNFDGVAETLHLDEVTFHTNLTQMVSGSKDYEPFRKSFAWKKWQHDWHGADAKNLTAAVAPAGP
jgi:hypothetical protein